MLPDFPKLKEKLRKKRLIPYIKITESKYIGGLVEIRKKPLYEGNGSILVREDGTIDRMKPKKIASEKIPINLKEIENITPEDIFNKLDKASEEMAKQKFHMIIEKVSKSAENVGNVVDVKGRPFTIDDFLKMVDIIWLDFDENGNPLLPTFLIGDKLYQSVSEELSKLETDPSIQKRYSEIIERKGEEWSARESNRELV